MKRTGFAELPLHYGACPPWLFKRMVRLSGAIAAAIISEFSRDEFFRRLADPFFFQSLGCVLGFDFHSSGLTTTVCGALKESLKPEDTGIAVCGGKGKASKRTPVEIERLAGVFSISTSKIEELKYASRMAAKVDNACVQDGYQLYHHCFFLSEDGKWVVVQQGMNEGDGYARRYHWLSDGVKSFVEEPHSGIAGDRREEVVLDMTARESREARKTSVDLAREKPRHLLHYLREAEQRSLDEYFERSPQVAKLVMPVKHTIAELTEHTMAALKRVYEIQPRDYEELVSIQGVGPKVIRSLALISDLIYGKPPSWRDPVKFAFCVGGKDSVPYPIDRRHYDEVTGILGQAIEESKIGREEKIKALKRLSDFLNA